MGAIPDHIQINEASVRPWGPRLSSGLYIGDAAKNEEAGFEGTHEISSQRAVAQAAGDPKIHAHF